MIHIFFVKLFSAIRNEPLEDLSAEKDRVRVIVR
jgi:hypothetical protein